jgi:hypothetical protein
MLIARFSRAFRQLSHPARQIYIKGTDLDTSNYNKAKAEADQLIQYYENYMQQKDISPEEMQDIKIKYENLVHQRNTQQNKPEDSVQSSSEEKFISPSKLKDIFDKMTEIDTDPNSPKSQQYFKQLEEAERTNK